MSKPREPGDIPSLVVQSCWKRIPKISCSVDAYCRPTRMVACYRAQFKEKNDMLVEVGFD